VVVERRAREVMEVLALEREAPHAGGQVPRLDDRELPELQLVANAIS